MASKFLYNQAIEDSNQINQSPNFDWSSLFSGGNNNQVQDRSYPNKISDTSFSDLSYQDTQGVHPPKSHSGLQSIMPHDLGNWRNNNAINYKSAYPQPFTPPNMLDVSGQVGEYNQKPGHGNVDMYTPEKKGWDLSKFPSVMNLVKGFAEKFKTSPEEKFGLDYFEGNMTDMGRVQNQANSVFGGKNVESMFGKGLEAAGQKRIDRVQKTIDNFSKQWGNLKEENPAEYARKLAVHQNKLKSFKAEHKAYVDEMIKQGVKDKAAAEAAKKAKYQGPVTHSYDPKQGGGGREDMSGATGTKKGGFSNPGKGAYGPWSAEGGYMTGDTRSRYSNGGRVGILSVF